MPSRALSWWWPALGATAFALALVLVARVRARAGTQRLASLVEHGAELVVVVDGSGRLTYASPSVERALGEPLQQVRDRAAASWVHPDDRVVVEEALSRVLAGAGDPVVSVELRLGRADRSWRTCVVDLTNRLDDPDVRGIIANIHDIDALRRLASTDALTGLANRSRFAEVVARLAAGGGPIVVVLLDIDGFRELNDSLGHPAGDRILVEVARRLEADLPGAVVARLGGDEYAVAVAAGVDEGHRLADRLVRRLREPVELDGGTVALSVSVGVAGCEDGCSAEDVLRHADLALSAAKDAGRDRWTAFHPAFGTRAQRRLELRRALESALDAGALDVHYQPVFSLPTGRVIGFEALARWTHPTRGPVPPSEFIEVAEDTTLIVRLGHHVLERSLDQLRAWDGLEPGGEPLHLAVNLSPRQLLDPGLAEDVHGLLRRAGVSADRLVLEITERAVLDHAAAGAGLERLDALGVRLAIDDYGSGNASIGYLRALPADVLKIDQSLVRSLQRDDGTSRALIRAITELADALGMTTVAEGIETTAQLRSVVALGCRAGQGYLLGRPVPAPQATAALERLRRQQGASASGPWLHPWWEPDVERPVA